MNKQKLIENLIKHGFHVKNFAVSAEAVEYLCKELRGKQVGFGGSMTLKEIGLNDALKKDCEVFSHWQAEQVERLGADAVRSLANGAVAYVCSANAVSETGEIVNIDGSGNRLAATAYGEKQVFFVVGENKIAEDLQAAIWRAKNVAAPLNARRLGRKTPCAVNCDKCYDCDSPERICNGILILERPMRNVDTTVVLIDEKLGY